MSLSKQMTRLPDRMNQESIGGILEIVTPIYNRIIEALKCQRHRGICCTNICNKIYIHGLLLTKDFYKN